MPKEPEMYLLQSWEALPDRTVALNFDGVSFRHSILDHKRAKDCKGVTVNDDGTISLLTHIGDNVFRYELNGKPEFYKIDGGEWKWVGEKTGEQYGER